MRLLLIVGLATSLARAAAQDYPQWRGVDRDGSASGFMSPASWPDRLTLRWRVEVGEGYASPLVIGNTVYVFARRDGNETVHALDVETGTTRWQSSYPAPYSPSQPAAAHGAGPKATPVFHDGRLFTLGISGILTAIDARTGKRLWQTDSPAEHPFFGAASSPVAEGGLVLAHPGNYDPLTAFDAASGAVRWKVGGGGFFQSPLVVTLGGVRQIVTVTQKAIIGVSLPAGELLWEFPFPGAAGGTMPVLYRDRLIVSGLDAGVASIRPARQESKWTVERLWANDAISMYISNPLVLGDTMFGFSHRNRGQLFALDATTGATLWLGAPRAADNAAFAKAGNLLFVLTPDGELTISQAGRPEATVLKRYTVAERATWADPVVTGTSVYIKDASALASWSFAAGRAGAVPR